MTRGESNPLLHKLPPSLSGDQVQPIQNWLVLERYILAFAYAHCSVQTLKPSCTIHSTASNTSFTWMRPVHIKSLPIGSWMPSFGFPTSFKSVLILILCWKAKGKNCTIRERKLQLLLTINCDLFADKSPPNLLSSVGWGPDEAWMNLLWGKFSRI